MQSFMENFDLDSFLSTLSSLTNSDHTAERNEEKRQRRLIEYDRSMSRPKNTKKKSMIRLSKNLDVMKSFGELSIKERETEYEIMIDLPGMNKEDIKVYMEEDCLVIEGERKKEAEVEGEKQVVFERFEGEFCRKIALPNICKDDINATYENGILKVVVNKLEVVKDVTMITVN